MPRAASSITLGIDSQRFFDPNLPILRGVPATVYTLHPETRAKIVMRLQVAFCVAPVEFEFDTGRVVLFLSENADGVTREKMLLHIYKDYESSSPMRQLSLATCLGKLWQRTRKKFYSYGVTPYFCYQTRKWFLLPSELVPRGDHV